MSDRHGRLEELFHRALDVPAGQRPAFLDAECGSDHQLRGELEALLREDAGSDEILQEAVIHGSLPEEIPESIGPYRITARIGEGGFAVVYAAEQEHPVRRRVAVKALKPGLETRSILARFEAERQALAMMDHPSIAKVFDAGQDAHGRPYFVMEMVEGETVLEFANRQGLDLRARVSLLITICRAIQHAHQKGVIHRDLKPSNVLVTTVDGQPLPKIIDFGIAKAMGFDLAGTGIFTVHGQFVGTPEYCSPEQADPGNADIDTRSDVYSLGVLAYELLTGELPFSRETLRRAGLSEVLRILREDDPPAPSTRVSSRRGSGPNLAVNLRMDRRTLSRRLKGDLDWIVLKALEKDRERRYETANGLAADLNRFLRGEPVTAGPPGLAYRARKLLGRHRVSVAVAASFLLLLMGFAATMTVQAQRLAAARDRAEQEARSSQRVTRFLSDLFEYSDPGEARGHDISARELLDIGAQRIESELTDEPLVRATLLVTMARVYRRIGQKERAARYLEEAVAIRERELGNDDIETVFARTSLGIVYRLLGRLDEAEAVIERCVEDQRRLLGEEHPNTQRVLANLANLYLDTDRAVEAVPLFEAIYRTRRKILGPEDKDTLYAMFGLAAAHAASGRDDLAEPLMRESLAKLRVVRGEDHPNTLMIMAEMGRLDARQGHTERAIALLKEALAGQKTVHGEDSDEVKQTSTWLKQVENGEMPK